MRKTKEAVRRSMRERLREFAPALHAEASLLICQTAVHLPAFEQARCVALFAPLPSEPDVRLLAEEAWAEEKRVVLPLMIKHADGPQLDWHEVAGWDDLTMAGPFGLREPDPLRCPRVCLAEIDCAFVPGMAFDQRGVRLGRGGGFYDYFLNRAPASLVRFGMMFECQRTENLPHEPHDHALPAVITETGVTSFSR